MVDTLVDAIRSTAATTSITVVQVPDDEDYLVYVTFTAIRTWSVVRHIAVGVVLEGWLRMRPTGTNDYVQVIHIV